MSAYLDKLVRRLSIDALCARTRQKRGADEYALFLSELEDCVPGGAGPEAELSLLAQAISGYLRTLSPQTRAAFVGQCFYLDSLKEVAAHLGMGQSKTKSILYRARQGLKIYLTQEGFTL